MKYIRTKSGRIIDLTKVLLENEYGYGWGTIEHYIEYLNNDAQDTVINQADTIEELCDEFVVLEKGKTKPFVYDMHCRDLDRYIKENATIYGAIWTDKGLIYVAKLNNKGEWELL